MANVTITQLPAAGAITGTEAVPIVQNGQTVQTTTAAIAASPTQTYQYLTVVQTPNLPNSRYLSAGTGLGLTDGGAQSTYQIAFNGVCATLESSSSGMLAKVSGTVTPRTLSASGAGLTVSNGDGQSGNPTYALSGLPASLANLSGSGIVALPNNGTVTAVTITGTANQIDVANGDGASGNPTISITSNPSLPGTGGVILPIGDTAARPAVPTNGTIRYNTDTATLEAYANSSWGAIVSGSGVTSVNVSGGSTGLTASGGPITSAGTITLGGTLIVPNGGTGLSSYTAGDMTYYAAGDTLSKLAIGTNGQIITSNGTAPQWSDASSISAGTATNLAGGTTGALPYQSGAGATSFLSLGTYTRVLTAGISAPEWTAQSSLSVGNATNVTISPTSTNTNYYLAFAFGSGSNPVQIDGGGNATYNPSTNTLTVPTVVGALTGNATSATNVAGGNANQIVYNTGAATTSFIVAPTVANTYLEWSGSAFQWSSNPLGTVTSVDVSGGTTGLTTSGGPITSSGTITLAGTLITSNGGTGLGSYTAGDMLYYASGTALSNLAIGSNSFVLTSDGSAPTWTDPSNIAVGVASQVQTTLTSTNATYYPTFVATTSDANPIEVDTDLTYNPSTNTLTVPNLVATSGISGGTF